MKRKCQNGAGKVNIRLELKTNEVGGTKTANDRKWVHERASNPTTRRTLLFLLHSPTTTRSFPSMASRFFWFVRRSVGDQGKDADKMVGDGGGCPDA